MQAIVIGVFRCVPPVTDVVCQVFRPGVGNVNLRRTSQSPLTQYLQTVVVRIELRRDHIDRTVASIGSDLVENVGQLTTSPAEVCSRSLTWHRGYIWCLQCIASGSATCC